MLIRIKHLLSKNGLTLTELVVATILMGVIMLGVASIDIGIRNAFEGTTENIAVTSEVSSIMHHISTNANQATGWAGVTSDPDAAGFVLSGASKLSIRVDDSNPPTPDDLTKDNWHIYDAAIAANSITYCVRPTSNGVCLITDQHLGNGRILTFTPQLLDTQTLVVTISGRFDPSEPGDAITNPGYVLRSVFTSSSMSGG
ncbi:MAG: prepilin-type N-terminal cleavage/methylation domain-containing protein [Candidatus Aceula meridiana]|nr:prepilin-type N-terminal cleavage/methylation domain-containing protein [Candidatus Aceula meridiana]